MWSFVSAFVPACDRNYMKGQRIPGSAASRSTSAGSSTAPGSPEETVAVVNTAPAPALQRTAATAFPEYDYPVPFIVKNTFIDTGSWRPSSLDGFFQEREIHSCVSRIGAPPGLEPIKRPISLAAEEPAAEPSTAAPLPAFSSYSSNGGIVDDQGFFDALDTLPSPEHIMWQQLQSPMVMPPPSPPAQPPVLGLELQAPAIPTPPMVQALRLAETIPVPDLGSIELHTIGSAGHNVGNCKPCAFFHTKGCSQGPQCEFCHLCNAGERKRRRKDKLRLLRESRNDNEVCA